MQTVMAMAFKGAGIAPKSVPGVEKVKLDNNQRLLIVFGCPRQSVPAGIQILPVGGGGTSHRQPFGEVRRFKHVKLDLDGLTARCFVESINVQNDGEWCKTYVNCIISSDGGGLKKWHGVYADFLRRELSLVWENANLRRNKVGTRLGLYGRCKSDALTKLFFSIRHAG